MELMDAIRGRRSVRRYKPHGVPDGKINSILEAATWAPKASERWEFIVVREPGVRNMLARASRRQRHVEEAPVDIVVCSNLRGAKTRDRVLYSVQESAAAAQNLMLKAYEEGLGTCLVAEFNEAMVRKALGIPRGVKPLALIPVGYADEKPTPPARKNLDEVVRREKY